MSRVFFIVINKSCNLWIRLICLKVTHIVQATTQTNQRGVESFVEVYFARRLRQMTVTTRPRNKETHPGLVDLEAQNNQQRATRLEVRSGNAGAVDEIDALEAKLLAEKRKQMSGARELAGPSVTTQPHARPSAGGEPVSLTKSRKPNTIRSTYILCFAVLA